MHRAPHAELTVLAHDVDTKYPLSGTGRGGHLMTSHRFFCVCRYPILQTQSLRLMAGTILVS